MINETIERLRKEIERSDGDLWTFDVEDVSKVLAEIEWLSERIDTAEGLLSDAHNLLDNVHCYGTEEYELISKFLYGDDAE